MENRIKVPGVIRKFCSGIAIEKEIIKSIIYTTDIAIIAIINKNDADAILAVYPFAAQIKINNAIISVANVPVICGVGGAITNGVRSVEIARNAQEKGAIAVVLNATTPDGTIEKIKEALDIKVILTVISENNDIKKKIGEGADILNVAGGKNTTKLVEAIRKNYPDIPIIATGGNNEESIISAIKAGANVITYKPPTNGEILKEMMDKYRKTADEGKSLSVYLKN